MYGESCEGGTQVLVHIGRVTLIQMSAVQVPRSDLLCQTAYIGKVVAVAVAVAVGDRSVGSGHGVRMVALRNNHRRRVGHGAKLRNRESTTARTHTHTHNQSMKTLLIPQCKRGFSII